MKLTQQILNKIEKAHFLYLATFFFITVFIVYSPALFGNFIWDDEEQVQLNVIIRNLSNIPYLFTSSTFNSGGAGLTGWYYKPLMPLSFSLIYSIWRLNPFGFHLFDLALHFVNVTLVFFLLKKLFSEQGFSYPKGVAFLLSLIFLVHPAISEAVVYISSTQELLFTFFFLIAFYLCLGYFKTAKNIKSLIFINLAILLSLLSKESGITTIPIILCFSFLFYKEKFKPLTVSFLITFFTYLILRFPLAKTPFLVKEEVIPIASASFPERLQTIPFEIFSYLRLIIFPKDLFISQHQVIYNIADPRFYLTFPLVIITLFLLIFFYKKIKSKIYLFFLLWIVFSFSILLNIYPLDMTIAERWLYAPLIGVIGLFGVLISYYKERSEKIFYYLVILIIVIVPIFSVRTFLRTIKWTNDLLLYEGDIKTGSSSYSLSNNYGVALFRVGKYKEAKEQFKQSINLSSSWWTSYNNLGVVYMREGNIKKAKALFELAIRNGNYYLAFENLGDLKFNSENHKDLVPFFKEALYYLPNNEKLNKFAAVSYYENNATDSAILHAKKAYAINPTQDNYLLIEKIQKGESLEDYLIK